VTVLGSPASLWMRIAVPGEAALNRGNHSKTDEPPIEDSDTRSGIAGPIRDAISSPKVGNTATDSIPGEVSSNHRTASRVEGFPSTMPIRRVADLERKWAGAVEFRQGGFNSEGTHIAALP